MEIKVDCQKRPEGSKPNALRRNGLVPAVLYGHNGTESISLTIDAKIAKKLLQQGEVNNTIVDVNIPEISWSGKTLLREVQQHPWKKFPYHLSFFAVAAHGDLDVEVNLNFVGEAVGVKLQGGMIDTVITQLKVKCAADRIPEAIDVDISELHVGESLHISQLNLPEGVTATDDPNRTVVTVLSLQGAAAEA